MKLLKSKNIYKKAVEIIPGGVNSPVRAFKSVDRDFPIFIKKGSGSKIYDEDGNEYIDYICSWGPLILGHNHKKVLSGVREVIECGSSFGLPTKIEKDLAEIIVRIVPNVDKVRLTSSGTEATMSAVRLARAYTKRNKILKFSGCYHGHSDALLVSSGSGLLTDGYQDSNGITDGVLKDTIICNFNDEQELKKILEKKDVACVIVEPIPANMGVIETEKSFLKKIRELCDKTGTLLIFDEVISGFRIALGGAQEYYGVSADIVTFGKIIGGGYPVGAFAGKKEIMDMIAPVGRVYQAGTLSGNPVSVRAGYETLKILEKNKTKIYDELEIKTKNLVEEIKKLSKKHGVKICVNRVGSLFTIFFNDGSKVKNMDDAIKSDTKKFSCYFNTMIENGIVVPPSQFEAHFVSLAHTKKDIEKTIAVIEKAFINIKNMK